MSASVASSSRVRCDTPRSIACHSSAATITGSSCNGHSRLSSLPGACTL
jgi:hypothetical protein